MTEDANNPSASIPAGMSEFASNFFHSKSVTVLRDLPSLIDEIKAWTRLPRLRILADIWFAAKPTTGLPSWEGMNIMEKVQDTLPCVSLLEVHVCEPRNRYRYAYFGLDFEQMVGHNKTGRFTDEYDMGPLDERVREDYDFVAKDGRITGMREHVPYKGRDFLVFEGLLLPLSKAGTNEVDHILSCAIVSK